MVRKRLGDLIREEAGKALTPEAGKAAASKKAAVSKEVEVKEFKVNPPPAPTSKSQTARRTPAKAVETTKATAAPKAAAAKKPAADPKVAELTASLAAAQKALSFSQQHEEELKQQLAIARQREQSLGQQLTNWETKLAEQQAIAHRLQADLNQTEKLQTELAEAKQVILKLSAQQATSTTAKPSPPKSSSEAIAAKPKPEVYKFERIGWTPLSPHLIEPTNSPNKSNDIDLGWVD
jgi:chromosome segregation ATPase